MSRGKRSGCIETGIRNSPYANAPIVSCILQKPINGIICITALIHVLVRFLLVNGRRHFPKMALALVSAAHILVHENVFFAKQLPVGTKRAFIIRCAIWVAGVWSALH